MNAKLQLLRGRISDLLVEQSKEEFMQTNSDRKVGAAMATGLAAAGLAGAASSALLATAGAGDSVELFTCIVGGQRVAGRFTKASFKNGDSVEIAAESQRDGTYAALAVRRPSDRTVWMFPHCSRGRRTHLTFSICLFLWILLGIFIMSAAFILMGIWTHREKHIPFDLLIHMGIISVILSLISSLYFSIRFATRWLFFVRKAEAIFTAFGYRDPGGVDMEQQHKKYLRQHGGKWPYLVEAPWVFRYADAS